MKKGIGITARLRKVAPGQSIVLKLPNSRAMDACKTVAYRVGHEMHCRFKAQSDFVNRTLTLTRLPYGEGKGKSKDNKTAGATPEATKNEGGE